jgi:hypothetical protein
MSKNPKLAEIIKTLQHNGRRWWVVKINGSFFARDDNAMDTGPYSTPAKAVDWIEALHGKL